MRILFFSFIFFYFLKNFLLSKEIYIAVSSNFLSTLQQISFKFEKEYNCSVIISSDSTVNLFNKIKLGMPFDIFISADSNFPKILENTENKSNVYAFGKLVFFKNNFMLKKNFFLFFKKFKHICISNPKLTPYGFSSVLVFENLRIKNFSFIFGANINQTFSFIYHGSSDFGIAAFSQIIQSDVNKSYTWKIPKYLYNSIEQSFIILENSKNYDLAKLFIDFFNSKDIKLFIRKSGYKVPL